MTINNDNYKHIDCSWLIKESDGSYRCCDIRGPFFGIKMTEINAIKKACKYIHLKRKKKDIRVDCKELLWNQN